MAGGVGALTVSLGLDAAEYTKGLSKAEQEANRFADSVKGIAIGTAIGDAFSGVAIKVFEGLHSMTLGAIDAADHLNDLAKASQVSVEQIGGIGFAASQAGSSVDGAAASLGRLNLRIAKAAAGDKDASAAFKAMGVSAVDAAGHARDTTSVMADVAEKFASYKDGPEKAALGNALFDKSYQSILPLLNDGGKALQDNIDYFKKYSGVSQQTADDADRFNDTLGKIHLISAGLGSTIAGKLLPSFQGVAEQFLAMKEKGDLFNTIATAVKEVFDGLVIGAANVVTGFLVVGRESAELRLRRMRCSTVTLPAPQRLAMPSKRT